MPEDFHRTFALVLCWTAFHDCDDTSRRKEFMVSVGVVLKLAWYNVTPFATATDEFRDDMDDSPTGLAPLALEVISGCILRPVSSAFYGHA